MATYLESTGTIIKTARNNCDVSVTINNEPQLFSVGKKIFYIFGLKCDGDLDNILEVNMEVELCYKIPRSGSAPQVVLVWLGEKPVDLFEEENSKPVYDGEGRVISLVANHVLVQSEDGYSLLVNRNVVYRDNILLDEAANLNIGEQIKYDAVPFQSEHFTGASYEATCAWIGAKPKIVDRFCLRSFEQSQDLVIFSEYNVVCGTVAVIPSDTVAFLDVEYRNIIVKVMLFRSSFNVEMDRVQDVISVGDVLSVRVSYACLYPGSRQWIATRVFDGEDSVDSVSTRSLSFEDVISCGIVMSNSVSESENSEEASSSEIELPVSCRNGARSPRFVSSGAESPESFKNRATSPEPDRSRVKTPEHVKTLKYASETETQPPKTIKPDKILSENKSQTSSTKKPQKDDILYNDPPLLGVFKQLSPKSACVTFEGLKIFADHDFYVNGKRKDFKKFIPFAESEDNFVSFEAVPKIRHENDCEFTHEATCIWVGRKPPLHYIAEDLPPPKFELVHDKGKIFYGVVSKICLPGVALVYCTEENTTITVHVHCFVCRPQYLSKGKSARNLISNYVRVGDYLQLKVKRLEMYPKMLASYEVRYAETEQIRSGEPVPLESSTLLEKSMRNLSEKSSGIGTGTSSMSSSVCGVCVASAFKEDTLTQKRSFLIGCSGKIKVDGSVISIEHLFGSSKYNDRIVFLNGNNSTCATHVTNVKGMNGHEIYFDAEAVMLPLINGSYIIKRIWNVDDIRPPSEIVLAPQLDLKDLTTEVRASTTARIISVPLHDCAIAVVKDILVLVPFDSLQTLREVNLGNSSIDSFLSVGDYVGLKIEKRSFPGGRSGWYYRAVGCWALNKGGAKITPDDEVRFSSPRLSSWFNIWGFGDFYQSATVRKTGERFMVTFVPAVCLGEVSLNLFERGKVFVKGKLVGPEKFDVYVGSKVSFHVAHKHWESCSGDLFDEKMFAGSLFVTFGWIGEEPPAHVLLKDMLGVPKGSICSNSTYQVMVNSFPLPTHALCFVSYAPVLVALPQVQRDGNFYSVGVKVKLGDRIVVRIREETVDGMTVLISDDCDIEKVADVDYKDVVMNVSGKIEELPRPTGSIRVNSGKVMATFELCHVRRVKKSPNVNNNKWFENLSKTIYRGKRVYFSAMKARDGVGPYRAFEVYFD